MGPNAEVEAFTAHRQEGDFMWRTMRMAAYALAATLALSGFSQAQRDRDDDDDQGYYRQGYGDQAQQYGYQNGYNDGVQKGRHEGRERDPYDYQTPDWRQARRGYQRWMGSAELYHRAYQQGYRNGFESGYEQVAQNGYNGYRGNAWQSDGRRTSYDGDGIAYRFGQRSLTIFVDKAQEPAKPSPWHRSSPSCRSRSCPGRCSARRKWRGDRSEEVVEAVVDVDRNVALGVDAIAGEFEEALSSALRRVQPKSGRRSDGRNDVMGVVPLGRFGSAVDELGAHLDRLLGGLGLALGLS